MAKLLCGTEETSSSLVCLATWMQSMLNMHKSDDEHGQYDEIIYIISMREDGALVSHGKRELQPHCNDDNAN